MDLFVIDVNLVAARLTQLRVEDAICKKRRSEVTAVWRSLNWWVLKNQVFNTEAHNFVPCRTFMCAPTLSFVQCHGMIYEIEATAGRRKCMFCTTPTKIKIVITIHVG